MKYYILEHINLKNPNLQNEAKKLLDKDFCGHPVYTAKKPFPKQTD